MFNIILYQPEIPPNTGNIIRLCANSGARLHLIKPLGFSLANKHMRRAGLDYHQLSNVHIHDDLPSFLTKIDRMRLFACSTKGKMLYHQQDYKHDDSFIFGPETRGLPMNILSDIGWNKVIRIPMIKHSRSINLANSVSIILYEALRQQNFGEIQ